MATRKWSCNDRILLQTILTSENGLVKVIFVFSINNNGGKWSCNDKILAFNNETAKENTRKLS